MDASGARGVTWAMLVIGAILLLVLVAAVAIVGLPMIGPQLTPAPAAPSGDAAPTGPAANEPGAVDPSSFLWANASMIPPPAGRELPIAYSLQGGTLADREPVLDLDVMFVMGAGPRDIGRVPTISEPANGAVVYVADDGSGSQVRRATLSEPVADELLLELEPVVWAIAVTADGSHAYALLLNRDEPGDAGVVRIALDGSEQAEQVLGPAEPDAAAGGIRQVAIAGFLGWLHLSPDDRHLVRRVCSADACALDVLDLESGEVLRLADRDVLGVANGLVFWRRCLEACELGVTDLAGGEERPIGELGGPSLVAMAMVEDRPMLVHVWDPAAGQGSTLRALDPETGVTTELLTGGAGHIELQLNQHNSLKIIGPTGWVVVTVWSANGRSDGVAVRVLDGETIPVPPAPVRQPAPGL
jgi:hypothetical protein